MALHITDWTGQNDSTHHKFDFSLSLTCDRPVPFLINLQEQSPKRCFDAPLLWDIDFCQGLSRLKKGGEWLVAIRSLCSISNHGVPADFDRVAR